METERRNRKSRRRRKRRRLLRAAGKGLALLAVLAAAGLAGTYAGLWAAGFKKTHWAEMETEDTDPVKLIPESIGLTEEGTGLLPTEVKEEEPEYAKVPKPLPERYDMRDYAEIPAVPDQGNLGTCWAFASLTALTTAMPEEMRQQLSADHMSLQNSFGLSQDMGGDSSIAMAYLLAWQGPVPEKEDPYGDGVSPEGLSPICHVQEVRILEKKNYEAIKRAVYDIGGVQSSLYFPIEEDVDSFYYNGDAEPNHDVVIIGWDDCYPKEKFKEPPKADGAFLCMNSWGESFGDRGCFYVSYEDSQIGTYNVVYSGVEPADNYDRIYQSDLCGWTGQLGYGSPKAWFANVYEAEADETIEAVGLYATMPDTSCRIYVTEVPEKTEPGSGEEEQSTAGQKGRGGLESEELRTALGAGAPAARAEFSDMGFYTVLLDQSFPAEAGKRFAVIVEIESPGAAQPVAVEYQSGNRTRNVDVSDGEGYISFDGSVWEQVELKGNGNICLKAYSRYQ